MQDFLNNEAIIMDQEQLLYYMKNFKEKYTLFKTYEDYQIFSLLCIKYFFYGDNNIPFDEDIVVDFLTDKSKDGGIDALFVDPNSDENDIIVIQSKHYMKAKLELNDILFDLNKIKTTLNDLKNNKFSLYNEQLVTAYQNIINNGSINSIRVCFFTSYEPKNKRERNRIEKKSREIFNDFDIYFRTEIEDQIELCDSEKLFVEEDNLRIDKTNNFLAYKDSIMVNISAKSLQQLQHRRRNSLLGMNLRYYVRQKLVDKGIEKTIYEDPQNFWYKNNGIIIVCSNYKIDGNIVHLYSFSIINGGQTTNQIGRLDIDEDFYLQCKIIKIIGSSDKEKDIFIHEIAEASNAQKPIKKSDLKANAPEQLRLKERLASKNVYYITKKGDKIPKKYTEKYQSTQLEHVGKLSLATVLQMPGTARSNPKKMYNDEYYFSIFGTQAKEGVIADALKIEYYYNTFSKKNLKNKVYDEKTVLPMIRNGRTFQLACITFLCKINNNVFSYNDINNLINNNNIDELKKYLRKMGQMDSIIKNKLDNEEQIFFDIFGIIGEEILGYCFENALEKAEETKQSLAPSNYLKTDTVYYKFIIKRLWSRYNHNNELNSLIKAIFK